ncbi:IS3 family transposase [Emticicia sp. 21SJ11W-3]|uniref:IS3 family transposase n=1 Tax=Emticicia sp. 21SJ11W-3 TaxID=2916755 RepID=UPI0020A0E879|nr:IS3 family transposase [Emticicia sp. 21SJ11W-3]UTA66484.1 IS3 family transposase [Emticicia sp. 21SJ11W-3]UTA67392.1 IS3 family transposase [Emticicia sp. 21SJ11W-3]
MSIRKQSELLYIARSRLYYKPKSEGLVNLHLMRLIDEQYTRTPFYGVPRMYEYLQRACPRWILNKKRIERLYAKMGLRAVLPGPHTSKPDPKATYRFPYLLKGLEIERANQVWAADITYIPMSRGYLYLYAIIDLYSRFIVHWGVSNSMNAERCTTLTREAIVQSGIPTIFNTDQGSQFTSVCFQNLIREFGISMSMDGKGRAIDNIFIERFWRTLKYEYVYLNPANGGLQFYFGLDEYIRYYNFQRPHEAIEKMTPASKYGIQNLTNFSTKYSTSLV